MHTHHTLEKYGERSTVDQVSDAPVKGCAGDPVNDQQVLVEGRREKSQQWIGRTTQNRVLNFADPSGLGIGEDLRGGYCRVLVTGSGPNSLVGELVGKPAASTFHGFRILP